MFCLFSGSESPLRATKGPQRFPMDKPVCHEMSSKIFYYGMISLWENWALLAWEVDQEISDDLRHALAIFSLWRAPKGPQASPMVPNGQPCVPWEVQIRNFTMEWFYYGKTERCINERWIKEYLMIRAIFWPFSGSEGPSKGPRRAPMETKCVLGVSR